MCVNRIRVKAVEVTDDNLLSLVSMYPDKLTTYNKGELILSRGDTTSFGSAGESILVMLPSGDMRLMHRHYFLNTPCLRWIENNEYEVPLETRWLT